jgi:hypothetical protein
VPDNDVMVDKQCALCGRDVSAHDRQVRFRLPQPVLDSPERDQGPGAWVSHGDAESSVMMQVPSIGAFVRALLPVRLTGGHAVTFGVWVGVHPDDLQRAFAVWWEPEYAGLRIDGYLANRIEPWGLLGAPVRLEVRDPDQTPYCAASPDSVLSRVLDGEWPHEEVLAALP